MHLTVYVLGKVEPVFTGDVTSIPEKGQRVIVDEAPESGGSIETTYIVESICWTIKGGDMAAFVYLKGYNMDTFR